MIVMICPDPESVCENAAVGAWKGVLQGLENYRKLKLGTERFSMIFNRIAFHPFLIKTALSMTFGAPIKTCYSKYATFKGRAGRSEYWWYVLFVFIVSMACSVIGGPRKNGMLSSLWSLVNLLPLLAAGVRRMQDIGKPGWYIIIPFYNIFLAVQEGVKGPNEHGADPENMRPSFDFERQDTQ